MGLQGVIDGCEELLSILLSPGVWWGQGQPQRLVRAVSEREGDRDAFLKFDVWRRVRRMAGTSPMSTHARDEESAVLPLLLATGRRGYHTPDSKIGDEIAVMLVEVRRVLHERQHPDPLATAEGQSHQLNSSRIR